MGQWSKQLWDTGAPQIYRGFHRLSLCTWMDHHMNTPPTPTPRFCVSKCPDSHCLYLSNISTLPHSSLSWESPDPFFLFKKGSKGHQRLLIQHQSESDKHSSQTDCDFHTVSICHVFFREVFLPVGELLLIAWLYHMPVCADIMESLMLPPQHHNTKNIWAGS